MIFFFMVYSYFVEELFSFSIYLSIHPPTHTHTHTLEAFSISITQTYIPCEKDSILTRSAYDRRDSMYF